MTNREWYIWQLVEMSDEDFADRISGSCADCQRLGINCNDIGSCQDKLLDWLKQEHKEEQK